MFIFFLIINIHCGFLQVISSCMFSPSILPFSRVFVILLMEVSTVMGRISNIFLIKSLLFTRDVNLHSCMTAGPK